MRIAVNPYRWDQVDINLFYGRDSLRKELVTRLGDGQSFGITGGRRMGKTTLLRRVEADLKTRAKQSMSGGLCILPVYIDTLALPHPITPDGIFNLILKKIERGIEPVYKPNSGNRRVIDSLLHPFASELADLIRRVSDYRLQIVILFDEVEPILDLEWGTAFFSNWRAFLHNEPAISPYVSAAFAGASEMIHLARDIGSPLGNVLTWRELALFPFEDTALLVNEPTNNYLSLEFAKRVYQETCGHPFLTQYVMKAVCEQDLDHASRSLEQAVETFLIYEHDKFERWWEQLSPIAQQLYGQLVQSSAPTPRRFLLQAFSGGDVNRSLDVLCHTGIASFVSGQDAYTASGAMFSRWFLKSGTINVTPDLADQVDRLLRELERSLRRLLREHLESKYGPDWLSNYVANIQTKKGNETVSLLDAWCATAKRAPGLLGAAEALSYSELGDIFSLINREWGDLRIRFRFGKDPSQERILFQERTNVLISVRNALRHVRDETVLPSELLKAQAFCVEMLNQVGNSKA